MRRRYDRFGHDAPGGLGGDPFQGGFDPGGLRDIFGGDLFEELFGADADAGDEGRSPVASSPTVDMDALFDAALANGADADALFSGHGALFGEERTSTSAALAGGQPVAARSSSSGVLSGGQPSPSAGASAASAKYHSSLHMVFIRWDGELTNQR